MQKLLPEDQSLKFLDFGCGKAVILREITKIRPHYQLFGVDVSQKALATARYRLPSAKFEPMKENQIIPFKTNTFDVVLASDVLEHIYDTEVTFHELARVLKPNGQLIITVPFNGKLKVLLATLVAFDRYFHPYSPHIRFYSKSSLSRCLTENNLEPKVFGYFGRFYPISNGMYCIAQKLRRG